ncbi:MAG: protein kinase domain-containing protein [Solirubrobacteraceae bacterium]
MRDSDGTRATERRTELDATRATERRTALTRGPTSGEAPGPMVLDRYRLARRLGTGAFGTVWLARDERLERDVAVKILARERIMGGRFEREARAAARLSHPAIVTLYEAAVDDEGAYLVSELVRGETLGALLEDGRLSDRDIVSIGIALCDALQHAHDHGVVHRDVKPSNVLVPEAPAGPAEVAKLTDFGVARVMGGDALTLTGDVLGTLAYMAPEQADGLEAAEPADLYSLALVIYEALSGVNPVAHVRGRRSSVRVGMHLPPLRRQRRDLPRDLAAGIDLALRPRAAERGSIADLRRALAQAQREVGDEPGIVTAAFQTRPWSTLRPREAAPALENGPDERLWREPLPGPDAARADDELPGEAGPAWPPRALGALAASGLAVWLCATALAPAPIPLPAAGLLAAAAVLLLPRLGWAALIGAAAAAAVSQQRPGAAIVITIALLLPLVVSPAAPTTWSLSAGAPALGLIGLAGAWPAVAARAGHLWTRAALGAIGWVWLLLGAAIAGKALYLPRVPGIALTPPSQDWMSSPSATVTHLLNPLVSSGVLAPAAVWALASVTLPWLIRRRSLLLDALRVLAWAAIVVSCTGAAIAAVHGSDAIGAPPSALIGAAAAAAVALAPSLLEMWRGALHSGGPRARVP